MTKLEKTINLMKEENTYKRYNERRKTVSAPSQLLPNRDRNNRATRSGSTVREGN